MSKSRGEELLEALVNGEDSDIKPQSRMEEYLLAAVKKSGTEGLPKPISRGDALLHQLVDVVSNSSGGGGNLIKGTFTKNGEYKPNTSGGTAMVEVVFDTSMTDFDVEFEGFPFIKTDYTIPSDIPVEEWCLSASLTIPGIGKLPLTVGSTIGTSYMLIAAGESPGVLIVNDLADFEGSGIEVPSIGLYLLNFCAADPEYFPTVSYSFLSKTEPFDGWSSVTVKVAPTLKYPTFTEAGIYECSTDTTIYPHSPIKLRDDYVRSDLPDESYGNMYGSKVCDGIIIYDGSDDGEGYPWFRIEVGAAVYAGTTNPEGVPASDTVRLQPGWYDLSTMTKINTPSIALDEEQIYDIYNPQYTSSSNEWLFDMSVVYDGYDGVIVNTAPGAKPLGSYDTSIGYVVSNNNKDVVIFGSGTLSFSSKEFVYNKQVEDMDMANKDRIIILDGITTITTAGLPSNLKCTYIEIPDSVTNMSGSFTNCASLTKVSIGNGVIRFEDSLQGCSNLQFTEYDNALYLGNDTNPYVVLFKAKSTDITSCAIHENTRVIASQAFNGCTNLSTIIFPNNVIAIGGFVGDGCTNLTSITLSEQLTLIGNGCFYYCGSADNKITVTVLSKTPPTFTSTASSMFKTSCLNKIIVPAGCGEAYKVATGWSKFANYIEEATE